MDEARRVAEPWVENPRSRQPSAPDLVEKLREEAHAAAVADTVPNPPPNPVHAGIHAAVFPPVDSLLGDEQPTLGNDSGPSAIPSQDRHGEAEAAAGVTGLWNSIGLEDSATKIEWYNSTPFVVDRVTDSKYLLHKYCTQELKCKFLGYEATLRFAFGPICKREEQSMDVCLMQLRKEHDETKKKKEQEKSRLKSNFDDYQMDRRVVEIDEEGKKACYVPLWLESTISDSTSKNATPKIRGIHDKALAAEKEVYIFFIRGLDDIKEMQMNKHESVDNIKPSAVQPKWMGWKGWCFATYVKVGDANQPCYVGLPWMALWPSFTDYHQRMADAPMASKFRESLNNLIKLRCGAAGGASSEHVKLCSDYRRGLTPERLSKLPGVSCLYELSDRGACLNGQETRAALAQGNTTRKRKRAMPSDDDVIDKIRSVLNDSATLAGDRAGKSLIALKPDGDMAAKGLPKPREILHFNGMIFHLENQHQEGDSAPMIHDESRMSEIGMLLHSHIWNEKTESGERASIYGMLAHCLFPAFGIYVTADNIKYRKTDGDDNKWKRDILEALRAFCEENQSMDDDGYLKLGAAAFIFHYSLLVFVARPDLCTEGPPLGNVSAVKGCVIITASFRSERHLQAIQAWLKDNIGEAARFFRRWQVSYLALPLDEPKRHTILEVPPWIWNKALVEEARGRIKAEQADSDGEMRKDGYEDEHEPGRAESKDARKRVSHLAVASKRKGDHEGREDSSKRRLDAPEQLRTLLEKLPEPGKVISLISKNIGAEGAKALADKLPSSLQTLELAENHIGAEGAKALAGQLPSSLQTLDLYNNNIGDEGAKALASQLPSSLQTLELGGNNIGAEGAKALAGQLPSSLQTLHLRHNVIGAEGAKALASQLPSSLQTLELGGNNIGAEGAKALAGQLPSSLQTLELAENHIGAEGAKALAGQLPSSLQTLQLINNRIGAEGVKALADKLPSSLQTLELAENHIGAEGAKALAGQLPSSLQTLDLYNNNIGDEGAKALASQLPSSLQTLELGGNNIGAEGAKALAGQLPSSLQTLHLRHNVIGAEGAKALAGQLPLSLQTLQLINNRIGAEGVKALAGQLPSSLQTLDLRYNDIGAEGAEALAGQLPSSLQRLHLRYNDIGDEGAKALADKLPLSLQILHLEYNGIGAEGAKALAGQLPLSLQTLDLGYNRIGDEGAKALAGQLPSSLQTLSLGDNGIGAEGAKALAGQLPSSLQTLHLSGNDIGAEGAKALADKLPSSLQTLLFANNGIGIEVQEELRALARTRGFELLL